MVIALSPALIIALVGSLCFFLIDVCYRGHMAGSVRWVMFWFVVAIVLISRIAIEKSSEYAALYGLALGAIVWLYMIRQHPAYVLGLLLLALLWFCAHKLVWDCTLIDDDQDSSGQGLLQSVPPAAPPPAAVPRKGAKPKPKRAVSGAPGRWVVYFSVAALPLFGVGQVLLPAGNPGARREGFAFLILYMGAALGLLVTTSFLGLRRYLRQRYLSMPGVIALAWVKFGAGVALLVLAAALFLPRPGAGVAWGALRREVDYRLDQASQLASRANPPGKGQGGTAGDNGVAQNNSGGAAEESQGTAPAGSANNQPGAGSGVPAAVLTDQAAGIRAWFRAAILIGAGIVAGWWVIRCRHLLGEMLRLCWVSARDFFRRLLDLVPARKPVRSAPPGYAPAPRRPLSEFKNPFYAGMEYARPPAEIILYTYDALQAWAGEQGIEERPEQTAREFCRAMAEPLPEADAALRHLAYLYAHAAYGTRLPPDCDLEPLKELWRRLTWRQANAPAKSLD